MAHLSLSLLGRPAVVHGGRPVTFATRKTLALLAFVAVEAGEQSRERLTALLWPESDAERGPGSLRRTLAYLRDALGEREGQPHLVAENGRLRLAAGYDLDLDVVRASLTGPPDVMRLQAAAAVLRGELLEGLALPDSEDFDAWASLEREAWHARAVQVFNLLSGLQAEAGDTVGGLEIATRWISFEPLDESAHRRLMQIHLVRGDRSAALRAYQACRRLLADELGAEPDAATQALHEIVRTAHTPVVWPSPAPPEPAAEAPMIGRGAEHRLLVAALRSAAAGTPCITLVEGESGIGKSRLVREYCAWAAAFGADVMVGSAMATSSGMPYQAISDALRTRLAMSSDPRTLLGDVWLAELARLIPDLVERCPGLPAPVDNAGARLRLFEAVARLVEAIARHQPALLVLDDLQWADGATRDLLAYAIYRWAEHGTRVLLLIAARNDDPDLEGLVGWLADLERVAPVERVRLEALDADDTAQLVNLWPGAAGLAMDLSRLYVDTGGRPLLLTERLRYLLEGGIVEQVAPGVEHILRARVLRFSEPARGLAAAAAVLGRPASFDVLSQVADLAEHDALRGLEELLTRRALQATSGGYDLSHADLQRVVYNELNSERLVRLHRRALRALEALSPPAELVRHALAAGDPLAARELGIAAGLAALRVSAARAAIAHFQAAFAIDDTPGAHHLDLARAFELGEDAEAAGDVYRRLQERAAAVGDRVLAARALARWAILEAQSMRLERALALAAEASETATASLDDATQVEAALGSALIHTYASDLDTALDRGVRAVELARAADRTDLVARSLNAVAFTRQLRGDWDLTEAPALEAAELFKVFGDRAMEVDSRCYVAATRIGLGDHAGGIVLAREALAMSREIDNPWGVAHSAHNLAWGLLDAGAYRALMELEETALGAARSIRFAPLLCLNLVVFGAARRAILDPRAAVEYHREALQIGRQLGGLARELAAGELCADLAVLAEWTAAAEAALEARAADRARMYTDLSRWAQTEALLRAGYEDVPPAPLPGDRYRIPILRAQAIRTAMLRNADQAIQYLEVASDLAARLVLPGDEWLIRRDLAGLYERSGSATPAAAQRAQAGELVGRLARDLPASLANGLRGAQSELIR